MLSKPTRAVIFINEGERSSLVNHTRFLASINHSLEFNFDPADEIFNTIYPHVINQD